LTALCLAAFLVGGCVHYRPVPAISNPAADAQADPAAPLRVGFAKEVITPKGPVWMAGFGTGRRSLGVHDDLYARVVVLRQGPVKLALVALDLLGLQGEEAREMKARVAGFSADEILIACTHDHSGPDTLGMWGPVLLTSGIDRRYMDLLGDRVAEAVKRADAAVTPVAVAAAVYPMAPEIMFNARRGEPEDETMGLIVFRDRAGKIVATLINAAGHAETMWSENRYISSDYPGRVCALSEERVGGGAIFFNGALGAMITPNLPQSSEGRGWETLERVSRGVFAEVEKGMDRLQPEERPTLRRRQSQIIVPVTNREFILGARLRLFHRDFYRGNMLLTSVSLIELGEIQIVTFPGEAYPKLGLAVRARQKPLSFQFGLVDDELGYILYPDDFSKELYHYESSMSVGPELSGLIERALDELLSED
jgi:hypothetical protein